MRRDFGERSVPEPRISDATFYKGHSRYGGMEISKARKLRGAG